MPIFAGLSVELANSNADLIGLIDGRRPLSNMFDNNNTIQPI